MFLYITVEKIKEDKASAIRILLFCKMLTELGKEVIVISLDETEPNKIFLHKGIKCISIRSLSNNFVSKVFNYIFYNNRLKKCFRKLNIDIKIEGLICYGILPNTISYLIRFAENRRIKMFYDSVEWFSPRQFKWRRFALPYILNDFSNKYFIKKPICVFAISKYLDNHFQSHGIRSTRIPILFDMNEIQFKKYIDQNKLTLVFAGSPGKKDYLKEIIEGLAQLTKEELESIEFKLLGASEKQLLDFWEISESTIKKCGNSLIALGRVTRAEVLTNLQKADFTVLLRSPELRFAKAGFPSKVVESLGTGTPVICNITSDLEDYLINDENSLIVKECTPEAFEITLRKAMILSCEEKQKLYLKARETAEKYFDYRNYLEQFNAFLSGQV
jgi:glycosyltransferase involved in cell wall biosynthesis